MNSLINKIGLGTVQFGANYGISNVKGKTPDAEVKSILAYAQKSGINYLDTAHAYGTAELVLGKNNLNEFKIVSKYLSGAENSLEQQIHTSLKRLKQSSLYAYLAHRPLDLIENNCKNWKVLQDYKSKGKVAKIGASFNTIEEMDELLSSGIQLDIIQVPYNFFDTRFEKNMQKLHKSGCEIHTRSTFLQGLFFCNTNELSSFFEEVKPLIKELQRIENLATQLLQYVLKRDFIDVVNIGVNNLDQLVENISLLGKFENQLVSNDKAIKNEILIPSKWPKH
ncbi:aldo/keto reductase [Algibacter sp. L3A6]|uniref:aldo/keto reductase n=1 Tax=Algibacter sp. L3A6 TaxID=2686366 RepID=UPI00131D3C00|nr:aldo/keto reductase [Algibacter sp. L3A6]